MTRQIPPTSCTAGDELFNELADTIDRVDAETRERLAGGELERRREEIMGRVRRRPTGPEPGPEHP